jgi:hypothetical protein
MMRDAATVSAVWNTDGRDQCGYHNLCTRRQYLCIHSASVSDSRGVALSDYKTRQGSYTVDGIKIKNTGQEDRNSILLGADCGL